MRHKTIRSEIIRADISFQFETNGNFCLHAWLTCYPEETSSPTYMIRSKEIYKLPVQYNSKIKMLTG